LFWIAEKTPEISDALFPLFNKVFCYYRKSTRLYRKAFSLNFVRALCSSVLTAPEEVAKRSAISLQDNPL